MYIFSQRINTNSTCVTTTIDRSAFNSCRKNEPDLFSRRACVCTWVFVVSSFLCKDQQFLIARLKKDISS